MTEIIWRAGDNQHKVEIAARMTGHMLGDYIDITHLGQRWLLRVEERVVPVDDEQNVQLRCVIAAEEVRVRIFGETDCETA